MDTTLYNLASKAEDLQTKLYGMELVMSALADIPGYEAFGTFSELACELSRKAEDVSTALYDLSKKNAPQEVKQ